MTKGITVGFDEVGYGAWAGPVVVGAYAFTCTHDHSTLRDSKSYSSSKRTLLATQLIQCGVYGLGFVSPCVIDALGLSTARKMAAQQANTRLIERIQREFRAEQKIIVKVDGPYNFTPHAACVTCIVRGDVTEPEIAAASIIAKQARDNNMTTIALLPDYSMYGFELHKGYGTARHIAELKRHGPSNQHRLSYKPIQHLFNVF
jgi:ribonuclease HII